MLSSLITSHGALDTGNRRVSRRKKLAAVVLLFLEEDNWGRLINISEGGMAFEFLRPPSAEHTSIFVIEIFGVDRIAPLRSSLQTEARLVWTNERNKTAGVQFINLTVNAQQQINHWLSIASSQMIDEISQTHQEKSGTIEAQLRKLFRTTLKTPDQVMISAYRQYLHASFSHLGNISTEILAGETRNLTERTAESSSAAVQHGPLTTSPRTLVQDPEIQPNELQPVLGAIEENRTSETVGSVESEALLTVETHVRAASEGALLEPVADSNLVELIAETALLEPAAESARIELFTSPDVKVRQPEDSALQYPASPLSAVVEFVETPGTETALPAEGQIEAADASSVETRAHTAMAEPADKLPQELVSIHSDSVVQEPNVGLPQAQEISLSNADESPKAGLVETPQDETAFVTAVPLESLHDAPVFEPISQDRLSEPADARIRLAEENQVDTPAQNASEVFLVDSHHAVADSQSRHTESPDSKRDKPGRELDPKLGMMTAPLCDIATQSPFRARRNFFSLSTFAAMKSRSAELPKAIPLQQDSAKEARLHGVAIFCLLGCFVLLLVLGLGITLSRANRMAAAALLENIHKPSAKIARPQDAPALAAIAPFQVEVVDINNRRWLLNFGSPATEVKPSTPAPVSAARTTKSPQSTTAVNLPFQPGFSMDLPQNLADANISKENSPVASSDDSSASVNPRNDAVPPEKSVAEPAKEIGAGSALPAQLAPQSYQPTAPPAVQETGQYADAAPGVTLSGNSTNISNPAQSAVLISSVAPAYPAEARYKKIEGDVVIDAIINEAGHLTTMKVISGPSILRQAALDSLHQWEYQPARLRGQPVPVHVHITINFRLH